MTRQAKLKKFGIERTPYYKKFIKKPAIDKIVENRKRGVKNHYAEQYLLESLANTVRQIRYKQKNRFQGNSTWMSCTKSNNNTTKNQTWSDT
jgi:hypothetical protein